MKLQLKRYSFKVARVNCKYIEAILNRIKNQGQYLNLQRDEGPRCKLSELNWKLNYFSMDKLVDRVHGVLD
jgi:hypothetical protein